MILPKEKKPSFARSEGKMSLQEWAQLERLGDNKPLGKALLKRTEKEDEHPELYEGACLCRLCMSYAG